MSTAMTRPEREAFLAETRVGLVAVADPDGGALVVPVWYAYDPKGGIRFATAAGSRKVALLRAAGRAGFCVQSEQVPYRYVSIDGPVAIGPVDYEPDVRAIALRYLGDEQGEKFLATFYGEDVSEHHVRVTITPERWRTVDYSKAPVF